MHIQSITQINILIIFIRKNLLTKAKSKLNVTFTKSVQALSHIYFFAFIFLNISFLNRDRGKADSFSLTNIVERVR